MTATIPETARGKIRPQPSHPEWCVLTDECTRDETDAPWHFSAPIAWIPAEDNSRIYLVRRRADHVPLDGPQEAGRECVRLRIFDRSRDAVTEVDMTADDLQVL